MTKPTSIERKVGTATVVACPRCDEAVKIPEGSTIELAHHCQARLDSKKAPAEKKAGATRHTTTNRRAD